MTTLSLFFVLAVVLVVFLLIVALFVIVLAVGDGLDVHVFAVDCRSGSCSCHFCLLELCRFVFFFDYLEIKGI